MYYTSNGIVSDELANYIYKNKIINTKDTCDIMYNVGNTKALVFSKNLEESVRRIMISDRTDVDQLAIVYRNGLIYDAYIYDLVKYNTKSYVLAASPYNFYKYTYTYDEMLNEFQTFKKTRKGFKTYLKSIGFKGTIDELPLNEFAKYFPSDFGKLDYREFDFLVKPVVIAEPKKLNIKGKPSYEFIDCQNSRNFTQLKEILNSGSVEVCGILHDKLLIKDDNAFKLDF